ncbi:MAG: polysaccharide deacetylase family protein [bacterium]
MSENKRFSVVIPARNEENYIQKTIKSIENQDYKGFVEIIVVDNASIDKTAEVAKKLGAKVVTEMRVGLPRARETGRSVAVGDIIVYVDADTLLPKNYLTVTENTFNSNSKIVATSNPIKLTDGTPWQNFWCSAFFKIVYPVQNALLTIFGLSHQVIGGNFAVLSKSLDEIGGFDTSIEFYGEDLAISKHLAKVGQIKIISNLYGSTSARRLTTQGTFRTFGIYFKNFFTVLINNRGSNGNLLNSFLKITLILVILMTFLRYSHLWTMSSHNNIELIEYFLGLLFAYIIYGFFYPKSNLYGRVFSRFIVNNPIVSLTFDDGPSPNTLKVLEILKKENIKATFFLIGNQIDMYPEIAKQIIDDGHCIGNHSRNHSYTLPFKGSSKILNETHSTQIKIDALFKGQKDENKKIFRPPHGWRSPWMMKTMKANGYKVITWDVGLDYLPFVSSKFIYKRIVGRTKPGSIILLHDSIWGKPNDNRENLVNALPNIIKTLKKRGYSFARIDKMI